MVRLKGRYRLVTTAAADASSEQHLVPDSEDEQYSRQSSANLGSEDNAPCPHRLHVRHSRPLGSSSSQRSCPVKPAVSKGHQHNGNSAKDSYRQRKCHSYQKSGVAVHTEAKQQQSDCAEPQNFSAQTSQGLTGLQQAQQQQQDSSLDDTNSRDMPHLYACSALAGLARFHAYSAATAIGLVAAYTQYVQMQWQHDLPCPNIRPGKFVRKCADQAPLGRETEDMPVDSDSADQQVEAQAVEAASASSDQVCLELICCICSARVLNVAAQFA